MTLQKLDQEYIETLNSLKEKIKQAQIKASLSVNQEMICLYWEIGNTILDKQEKEGWGAKVIDRLSNDLSISFPDMKGFSPRNLKHMRRLAQTYNDFELVKQLVSQLPWGHNIVLLNKLDNINERLWYAKETIENGWSRNVLIHQIETDLYKRQVLTDKTTNFELTLPAGQSDLANEMIKDPMIFDFLPLGKELSESDLEKGLLQYITKVIMELGKGFTFAGNQYHLEVGGKDFYLDLLFFNTELNCYVVVELKVGEFIPEYAGKMNFYLTALDKIKKREFHNHSIGLLLCKTKNKIIAEYTIQDMSKPMAIAEYRLNRELPNNLKMVLPNIEELETEISTRLLLDNEIEE